MLRPNEKDHCASEPTEDHFFPSDRLIERTNLSSIRVSTHESKLLRLILSAAIGIGAEMAPFGTEAQPGAAQGPESATTSDLLGLRTRFNVVGEFMLDSKVLNRVFFDAILTHTSWTDEWMGGATVGTGIKSTNFLASVNAGATGTNCSTATGALGSNCPTNVINPMNKSQTASLGMGNFNINLAAGVGRFSASLNGALILSQSVSFLALAKVAARLVDNESGGVSITFVGQIRDDIASIGAGPRVMVKGGVCGKEGRIYFAAIENPWLAYIPIAGGKPYVYSTLNIIFSTEVRDCESALPY